MALRVAVQLYSVRDDFSADQRGTLQKVKDMGYEGVEFAGLFGTAPAEIKKMCEEIGLVPLSAHVPYVQLAKDPIGVLSEYQEIGCPFVDVKKYIEDHRGTMAAPYNMDYGIHVNEAGCTEWMHALQAYAYLEMMGDNTK